MCKSSFGSAYQLLINDFLKLTEYINPCDSNEACYSHRLYELLLRASTEFENLCKYLISKRDSTNSVSGNLNIHNYKTLESSWNLERKEVGLLFWVPGIKYIKPFDSWSTNSPPLSWYNAYNNVKHNREACFSDASLKNVVLSIGGLFLALYAELDDEVFNPYESSSSSRGSSSKDYSEKHLNNSIFTIRVKKQ